jgi:hypothetical protein
MKRTALLAALLWSLLPCAALALGPSGALPGGLEDVGVASVGAGVLQRQISLDPSRSGFPSVKATQRHGYAFAAAESYGVEWTVRLGAADFTDDHEFDGGFKPFGGVGLRFFVYGDRRRDLGVVASLRSDVYGRYRMRDVTVAPGVRAEVKVKDLWDSEAALLANYRAGDLTFYAGPVFEYLEAKVYRVTEVPVGVEQFQKSYYKAKSNLGAAGGVSWQLGAGRVGVEGSASGGGYTAGVEASFGF